MRRTPIYLDCHATTPLDPRVLPVMMPYLTEKFGNPASSSHVYGLEAKAAVEVAREDIARCLNAADPRSICFTSGTTEANNLALKGLVRASGRAKAHLVSQTTEHPSVLETLGDLRRDGHEVTLLGVDRDGRVSPEELRAALRPDTLLVSVMWANNEIGTVQDIAALLRVTREGSGALFHADAAQAVGRVAVDLARVDVDFLSFSAHKIYGPKGAGALYVAPRRPKIRLRPLLHGGGHEEGLRSGTLNVPAVVGFAAAMKICANESDAEAARLKAMRDAFVAAVLRETPHVRVNGPSEGRLPGNANLLFMGTPAEEVIREAKGLALSSGAACASGGTEPSHVLRAIGLSDEEAKGSLRLGFGRMTAEAEAAEAARLLIGAVARVRDKSLSYKAWRETFSGRDFLP